MNSAYVSPRPAPHGRLIAFVAIWAIVVAGSVAMGVRVKSIAEDAPVPLITIVPARLPGWTLMPDEFSPTVINPQQEAMIQQIYDETVVRSYRDDASGAVVMLALAYGRDQSHKNQVHKPEVCYPAQGFTLSDVQKVDLPLLGRTVPSTRLTARLESRTEFVQYWMLQGDRVIRGALQQNLFRTVRALQGVRTDGLLFRTSVIGSDAAAAYAVQESFVEKFMNAVPPDKRVRFVGN